MTIDRRKELTLSVFIFICSVPVTILCQEDESDILPSRSLIMNWSQLISDDIVADLDSKLLYHELMQEYQTSGFPTQEIIGSDLLKAVAGEWKMMLEQKMEAVKNIVENLEENSKLYEYDPSLMKDNVTFINSKNFTDDFVSNHVDYKELFRSNVSMNYSSIQIPTDIYEGAVQWNKWRGRIQMRRKISRGRRQSSHCMKVEYRYPVILNSIRASDSVDSVFIENAKIDEQLLWQYFGSAKGFYRSYPAMQWVAVDQFDQYDVRRRGWYIQATSSPKNIMILIDTSGSTYGMTLEVIKVSVSKALDTLGNDDYVMVAQFNETASVLVSCFRTFVQANLRNKELLKEKIQELKASGQVNFNLALEFAFGEFEKFYKIEKQDEEQNNQGANCIRSIMIFTDGGREMASETIESRNKHPETGEPWVRIFVYNVGTDSMVPSDGVKSMACSTQGFFSNIRSFGAVRLTTLDYVPVLSRPMVLSGEKNFQWSDIYLDALGLGMMTTLTLPVYSKNKNGTLTEQLLGVVGTDITTKNMADTVPQRKIGPEGYAFGINTNGYILLHPRLKAEFGGQGSTGLTLGYLSDPPNVDFLEVEFADERKTKLRKDMIDGKTGSDSFPTLVMSSDERYVENVTMTYSYTFINKTTFSVALAQPFFDLVQYAPELTPSQRSLANSALSPDHQHLHIVLIAPWDFCESLEGLEKDTTEVYNVISTPDENECNMEAINKLWGDALATSTWIDTITQNKPYSNSSMLGLKSVFVATQGGLSRFAPKSSLSTTEEQSARQDPWEQNYYRRPLYKPDTYVFSVPYNDGKGKNMDIIQNITVSKALHINLTWSPAVVGAVLDAQQFENFWLPKTTQGENGLNATFCYRNTSSPHCFLLDDGGFIISTSADDIKSDVGRFFGEVDGRVMESLIANKVYNKIRSFDYQAACSYMPETGSAGVRSAFVPSLGYIMNLSWWLSSAIWSILTHTLYDLLIFGVSEPYIATAQVVEDKNVSCILEQTQYTFGANVAVNANISTCSFPGSAIECSRRWFSSRVPNTNLILLLVSERCPTTHCPEVTIKQEPQEADPEDVNPCIDAEKPRYRKRPPEKCYDYHEMESNICSRGVSVTLPGSFSLALFVLIGLSGRLLLW